MQVRVVCAWRVSCVLVGGVGGWVLAAQVPWAEALHSLPRLTRPSSGAHVQQCAHLVRRHEEDIPR